MTLRRMLKRLRFKPGDILVVRQDPNSYDMNLLRRLSEAGNKTGIKFDVPIVVVPDSKRTITIMQFDQLEKAYLTAKEARDRKAIQPFKENTNGIDGKENS